MVEKSKEIAIPTIDFEPSGEKVPWNRLQEESFDEFEKFRNYIAMPCGNRSVKAVFLQHKRQELEAKGEQPDIIRKKLDSIRGVPIKWQRMAKKNNWALRASQYDDEIARRQERVEIQEFQKHAARLEKVRQEHRDNMITYGNKLIEKAKAMLEFPLATREVQEVSEDGRKVTKIIVNPTRWRPKEAADMLKTADDLIATATGDKPRGAGGVTQDTKVAIKLVWPDESKNKNVFP